MYIINYNEWRRVYEETEAAALQRRVLDTVKEMGKHYDDEPAEPAAKRPKRMKFIDGAWHIPT